MVALCFLQCISHSPQFDVIYKLDGGLFSSIIQLQIWMYWLSVFWKSYKCGLICFYLSFFLSNPDTIQLLYVLSKSVLCWMNTTEWCSVFTCYYLAVALFCLWPYSWDTDTWWSVTAWRYLWSVAQEERELCGRRCLHSPALNLTQLLEKNELDWVCYWKCWCLLILLI